MKKNRFLWFLMIALIVPMMAISCEKKQHNSDSDDESDSSSKSEKVESDDDNSDTEKQETIDGEYKLEKESIANFFEQDILGEAKKAGITVNMFSSFNFNDGDELKCQIVFKGAYPIENNNKMSVNILVRASGTWEYDQDKKQLTANIKDVTLDNKDIEITFNNNNAKAKDAMNYIGGKEGLRKRLKIDADMEKFKGTKIFEDVTIMTDGFTAKKQDSKKTVKFEKVEY